MVVAHGDAQLSLATAGRSVGMECHLRLALRATDDAGLQPLHKRITLLVRGRRYGEAVLLLDVMLSHLDSVDVVKLPVAAGVDGDRHIASRLRNRDVGLVELDAAQLSHFVVVGTSHKEQCREECA